MARLFFLLSAFFSPTIIAIEEEPCVMCCQGFCEDDGGQSCLALLPPAGGSCEITGDGQSITCRSFQANGETFDMQTEYCGGFAQCPWYDLLCFGA